MRKIYIAGKGNIATHFGKKLKVKFGKNLSHADKATELFILAVKDDAIEKVAQNKNLKNKILVHTSGSIDMNVLKKYAANYGVLYPLQTISKKRKVNFADMPICIEAGNKKTEKILYTIALKLGSRENIYRINSKQRKSLHLAAVFANNFTNHMYLIANNILGKSNLPFSLLKPLILETAKKACELNPKDAQTGPAKRNDKKIIKDHLKILAGNKNYRNLYRIITNSILRDN